MSSQPHSQQGLQNQQTLIVTVSRYPISRNYCNSVSYILTCTEVKLLQMSSSLTVQKKNFFSSSFLLLLNRRYKIKKKKKAYKYFLTVITIHKTTSEKRIKNQISMPNAALKLYFMIIH